MERRRRSTWITRLVVAAATSAGVAAAAQDAPPPATAAVAAGTDVPIREAGLVEYVAARFSPHEPIYFLWGDDRPNVKFQVSLKYQLFNPEGPLAQSVPAVGGIYVAYTQTSFWDLEGSSSPFFDSSYRPEALFQRNDVFGDRLPNWLAAVDFQAGVAHESNGKSGPESRSLNVAYVRPVFSFGDPRGRDHGWFVSAAPRVFAYFGDLAENPDIDDYRGHADLRLVVGRWEGLQLASTVRIPDDFNFDDGGSLQLDLSFPLRRLSGNNLDLYLHAQYFTGFGESLLRYDEEDHTFRVGLSVVR
jgi:outer membrane phospholipase A